MARLGIKRAISLIVRKIGSGRRGELRRPTGAGAQLIASKTSGGPASKPHQRAGHLIASATGRLSPRHGLHARKFAPVVLLAAALAESAHAPLLKGAKAMSWNPPGAPRVQSPAGDAGQSAAAKSDLHTPPNVADQLRKEKPGSIAPDLKLWDPPALNADPITPQEPISLIHHAGDTVVYGPTNGGGGGSDVTPIVHGAALPGGSGVEATGGGGAADGGGAGGDGTGSGGGATPTVLGPTETVAVPEPASAVWIFGIATLLQRRRQTRRGHPNKSTSDEASH